MILWVEHRGYHGSMGNDDLSKQIAPALSAEPKSFLLRLARQAAEYAVQGQRMPRPAPDSIPAELRRPGAAFVTVTRNDELRGCVGQVLSHKPLYESVIDAATGAATKDSRFSPISASELPLVHLHLSVLSDPRKLDYAGPQDLLEKLRPGVDGVVLSLGFRMATFLPKVWERMASKVEFMQLLSLKAGLNRNGWEAPEAVVSVYQTQDFEETVTPGN